MLQTDRKIAELVRSLPPARRRAVLLSIVSGGELTPPPQMKTNRTQMKEMARKRGLNWDRLNDQGRLQLVDDLIHEDRACR